MNRHILILVIVLLIWVFPAREKKQTNGPILYFCFVMTSDGMPVVLNLGAIYQIRIIKVLIPWLII